MTKPASLLNKLRRLRCGPLLTRPNVMPEDEWIVIWRTSGDAITMRCTPTTRN